MSLKTFQTTTWATPSLSGPTSTANFRSGSCRFATPLVDRPRVYSAAVTKAAKWRGFLRARRPKLGASAALFHSLGQDGFLSLDKAAEAGELALEEERRRQRDGFLRQWHLNMEAEGKAATKWLHNKPFLSAQGVVVPNGDGSAHRTFDVEEAFELILGQWRRIWHRREAVPEMIEADGGDLRRPGRAEPQVVVFEGC